VVTRDFRHHVGSLVPPTYVDVPLRSALQLIVLSSTPEDRSRPAAAVGADQLEACRRGDRGALETVFRAQAHGLSRLLTRIVGPSIDVEDLLQETFAAAIAAIATFRGEASIKTWLHRIAIHVAHQHLRRPRHRREVPLDDIDEVAPDSTALPTAETRELASRLYAHLDALDADKRIALVLYVIEGHTVDEIAVLVGASRTATRSRIFWARRALLKRMRRDPAFADRGIP
jgi:RNA polymerase sigma-70 factor (ECF subfamily)